MAVPGCIPGSEFLLGGFQLRRKWISKLQREKRNKNKITKIPPKKLLVLEKSLPEPAWQSREMLRGES